MLGLFKKIKDGLSKTHDKLTSEIKRIVTRSPRLTAESLDELEAALLEVVKHLVGRAVAGQILTPCSSVLIGWSGPGCNVCASPMRA